MRALVISALCVGVACAAPKPPPPPPAPPVHEGAATPPAPSPRPTPSARRLPSWIGARFDAKSTRVLLVIPGAPAERGGLRPDDEVVTVDGQPMTRASEIVERIQAVEPGMTVTVVVQRQGATRTLVLAPEPRPEMMDVVRQALIGKPAPDATAERISGTYPATLTELRGHVVVLDFWATWCGPCAMTLPRLGAWQAAYAAKGLRIVGLSSEDTAEISAFLVDHELGYTIARDPDAKAAQAYLLQGVPMLVIIDKAGIVRNVFLGAGNFDAIEAAIVQLL